jgi:hypothetical protein
MKYVDIVIVWLVKNAISVKYKQYKLRNGIWVYDLVWMKRCIQKYILLHKPDIL